MYRVVDLYKQEFIQSGRGQGRTHRMIMELPKEFEGNLYIVAYTHSVATYIISRIRKFHGDDFAKRCKPIGSNQAINVLRGVDPLSIYFDHTALEYGAAKDIRFMYSIIDRQNIFG
jgi:hypothetical protein